MYLDSDKRPLSPQLAVRVAVIGGIALVAFAVIFFRLWYLQVLSGDKYRADANDNQVREIKVEAPRGQIVDREGRILVQNRTGLAVRLTPDKLPQEEARRDAVYARLGKVLGKPAGPIKRRVERQLKAVPFSAATVKADASRPVVEYLLENQDKLPGVTVERVFLRSYPERKIGAHLFGTVGEINAQQIKQERYRGVALGDRVGQSGVEYQYDRFLRGRDGASRVQVDALGTLRDQLAIKEPVQGRQLRLSVDLQVQRAGQQALGSSKGAFVAMDVRTGEVYGLGSSPSFDPNIFAKEIKASDYKRLSSKQNGEPLANRAIQSVYPTGSTFKLITATAALEGGLITPDTTLYDGGSITVGGITFKNDGGGGNGSLALRRALTVSSDVFFYRLGQQADGNRGDRLLIQEWARKYGFGAPTGIDIPGEAEGLVPSPEWRNRLFRKKQTDRPWSVGDNINLAVGQGDLQADPLQLATAYAAIANGGKVVRPRIGRRIEDSAGRVVQELQSPAPRTLNISPANRQAILDGLRGAASESGGTSADVFRGFPIPVAGKTGTAERGAGRPTQSWYAGLAPYPNPRFVVVATDEAGGYGAERAAPMVRQIMSALFDVKGGKAAGGGSRD